MSQQDSLLEVAKRQLEICNSCRYCEGYCSVFPALERRVQFTDGDVVYLANLCHDCRACYQACPYTPPHELAINIPAILSDVRVATYSRYAWPQRLSGLIRHSAISTALLSIAGLALVLMTILVLGNLGRFWSADPHPGSFYRIIPYLVLVVSGLAATAYILGVIGLGSYRFWREVRVAALTAAGDWRAWVAAVRDVAIMANLSGGGGDCFQPDPLEPSAARRVLHQAVLYGFLLAFVSTVLAALFQDILGVDPPFSLLSPPVITGSIGGMLMVIGCTGLLWLKSQSVKDARGLISGQMLSMDSAFIITLDVVAITGMLTLLLRDTGALASMLTLHLASLVALYLTAPYGKFLHGVYRFLALLKNRVEQRSESRDPLRT